ncbi:ATP-dependent DNA helicase RecG [Candidatus Dependentiae bacterium]|nr:ATP-dependent DNA helicase RecG [Candidatus Dependentiae bacterium]
MNSLSCLVEIRNEINAIVQNKYKIALNNLTVIRRNTDDFIKLLNKKKYFQIIKKVEKIYAITAEFDLENNDIILIKKKFFCIIDALWDLELLLLNMSIDELKGIGKKYKNILLKKNIVTIRNLIEYFPYQYMVYEPVFIKNAEIGGIYYISGNIVSVKNSYIKPKKMFYTDVLIDDGTGIAAARFYGNPAYYNYKKNFAEGLPITVYGKLEYYNHKIFNSPSYKLKKTDVFEGKNIIEPVYSLPNGISNSVFRKILNSALEIYLPVMTDFLPVNLKTEEHFCEYSLCVKTLHNPKDAASAEKYKKQAVYYNFFLYQLRLQFNKIRERRRTGVKFDFEHCMNKINEFIDSLEFELTESQKSALNEIMNDMKKESPMMRLMQGDVGCGKTIISVILSIAVIENGYQFVMMAPSEILAEQHFKTFVKYLGRFNYNIVMLNSSVKKNDKEKILQDISSGVAQIIIGTHSLIGNSVKFSKPGFIVIDEQHKFGVYQRELLAEQKSNPDVLVMTATPIPRSLGLTIFSDFDITVINGKPAGRLEIKTEIIFENKILELYDFIIENTRKNLQTFIVYPAIEDNDKLELKSVQTKFSELSKTVFKNVPCAMIHGRMKFEEREKVMSEFVKNEIKVLFSTIVIEVGIDMPNANIIVIEHPERFGLAQLHQLRGRVGRNSVKSYCFLVCGEKFSENSEERIKFFSETSDGLTLSEFDLRNRGMGDLIGLRQSGLTAPLIKDIFKYENLMLRIKENICRMMNSGFLFENLKFGYIRKLIDALNYVNIGQL